MRMHEPIRRTPEIEDFTNVYFVHAIANRLVPMLARLRVHPNTVSVAGMVFGLSAGFAYFRYQDARFATAGFALMIAWHVMDGVDGQLARLTRSQSETGKLLDGICDYVTFTAVYAALAIRLGRQDGALVYGLVIAAGCCHAVQSAAYEMRRQDYELWGWGRTSSSRSRPSTATRDAVACFRSRVSGWLHLLYARVQSVTVGGSVDFHDRFERILASRPESAARIRGRYRELFARPIRRWSVLSANYRTIGIFLCALAKAPLLYFCFEIFGFSLILAYLTTGLHARLALYLKELGAADLTAGTLPNDGRGRG